MHPNESIIELTCAEICNHFTKP